MNGTSIKVYSNANGEIKKIKVQRFIKDEQISDYILAIGTKLVVNQMNKQATKNRGREVEVTGYKNFTDQRNPLLIKVKYLDTNRPGSVEIGDLDVIQNEDRA